MTGGMFRTVSGACSESVSRFNCHYSGSIKGTCPSPTAFTSTDPWILDMRGANAIDTNAEVILGHINNLRILAGVDSLAMVKRK